MGTPMTRSDIGRWATSGIRLVTRPVQSTKAIN